MKKLFLFAGLPLLLGAVGDVPQLILPIACKIGQSCAIQNYVDLDPSPAARDYRCSGRTYDDHNGIDFRLKSLAQMRRGVAVLAAADGRVLRARDGVADVSVKQAGAASVENIQCGNGVVISHRDGLETQYCHMARGSIAVRPGQEVVAGTPIGRVGLSGNTEYPHLHMSVRKDGKLVEPFAYGARPGQCGGGRSLWAPSAGLDNAYRAGEILNMGFATGPVTMQAAREDGAVQQPRPSRDAPVLVAFVQAIGLQGGDVQRLTLRAPDGIVLADSRGAPLDRDKAEWVSFTGKKRPSTGWPAGRYTADYSLTRGGRTVISERIALQL